ncbi:hypothetical protein Taro_056837 [Colocasia esculenta]|uniref:Uncharacterized protein n=1 Tax=Colocasia esculenta TaxID=4460 RepID=A0A843XV05_COLES|nr:hypothetical protein [Colocasia esculenta]
MGVIFGLTRVVVEAFTLFPLLCSRDSLSQEFVAGRSWWRPVLCVASSVSCERESSLYRELRVAFLQVLGLFEFIAYLTGLNSNPSGSSDPWVAGRPSGVPGGGLGGQVASFSAGFESVATVAGCACFERDFWFTHAVIGFVFGLCVRVGSECVAAVAGCVCFERDYRFARAAIGFVVGLRVRVGVS